MKAIILTLLFIAFGAEAKVCEHYGPQTPRDISIKSGSNPVHFNFAPHYSQMNLCNIHLHKNAEHKGPEFSVKSSEGYQCNHSQKLSSKELKKPRRVKCKNLVPGDTIEVHWVHTSCSVKPGPGLGSCLSESCANPTLRVEAQVYLLVNDKKAIDLMDLNLKKRKVNGFYQAKKIPTNENAIQFLGSTTGPKYTESKCSPLQVTWNVSPSCQKMDINSVHKWCRKNIFEEEKAHGVRELVKNKKLLAPIK